MRYLNLVLGVLMLAFAALQYNDPDGPLWMAIYAVPAIWAFAAAFRLPAVQSRTGSLLLWLSIAAGAAAVFHYWPQMPGFWHKEVWWDEETAREGMGVMIVLAVLLVVRLTASRRPSGSARRAATGVEHRSG